MEERVERRGKRVYRWRLGLANQRLLAMCQLGHCGLLYASKVSDQCDQVQEGDKCSSGYQTCVLRYSSRT